MLWLALALVLLLLRARLEPKDSARWRVGVGFVHQPLHCTILSTVLGFEEHS